MKWLPSPPTDNLYKFMAVFGLWLLLAFIFSMGFLRYLAYEQQKEQRLASRYFESVDILRDVNKRLKAIDEGRVEEDKIEWLTMYSSLNDEYIFLKKAQGAQLKRADEYNKSREQRVAQNFELLRFMWVDWIITALAFFGLILSVIGFMRWHRLIQKPSEKAQALDIQLKELAIEKARIEIRQLGRFPKRK